MTRIHRLYRRWLTVGAARLRRPEDERQRALRDAQLRAAAGEDLDAVEEDVGRRGY